MIKIIFHRLLNGPYFSHFQKHPKFSGSILIKDMCQSEKNERRNISTFSPTHQYPIINQLMQSGAGKLARFVFARASFYPSLFYNVVMEKVSPRKWYNRIDDTIIVGALPFKHIAKDLMEKENIKAVVSMNEDYELHLAFGRKEWENHGIRFLQLQTTDIFVAPNQEQLITGVKFIEEFSDKASVYIHCKAGRTRSVTLGLCYLVNHYKWTPAQAIDHFKNKRGHILLGNAQKEAVKIFYENYVLPNQGVA